MGYNLLNCVDTRSTGPWCVKSFPEYPSPHDTVIFNMQRVNEPPCSWFILKFLFFPINLEIRDEIMHSVFIAAIGICMFLMP